MTNIMGRDDQAVGGLGSGEPGLLSRIMMMALAPMGSRIYLWVDGVGGYLVCLQERVVLGQASGQAMTGWKPIPQQGWKANPPRGWKPIPPANPQQVGPDIGILGDLSRRHVTIGRAGEGYWIEAHARTRVAGGEVTDRQYLSDGSDIVLGTQVSLRFSRPHPLSDTARLEWTSFHRTVPAVDGILLMADSCILGPSARSHIVCRQWEHEVVLARDKMGFRCRGPASLTIDGRPTGGQGIATLGSRISGDDFCFQLEPVSEPDPHGGTHR